MILRNSSHSFVFQEEVLSHKHEKIVSPDHDCRPLAEMPSSETGRPNARLPTALSPIRYNLVLEPHLYPPWLLEGQLQLTFKVKESTCNITLNMMDIITKNDTAFVGFIARLYIAKYK